MWNLKNLDNNKKTKAKTENTQSKQQIHGYREKLSGCQGWGRGWV